jgi:hypothetical protein
MSTKEEKLAPAKPYLYGASRMLVVEPVSRKSTRKVGRRPLAIQQCRIHEQMQQKGNNKKINARIHDAFYPYRTTMHRLALIPLLGYYTENKIFSSNP